MQEKRNYFWIILPWLPAVIGACCLWGYVIMVMLSATNNAIEIVVAYIGGVAVIGGALIAGVIALIGQWRQLKRDGKTINKISDHASDMKPKVEEIQSAVRAIGPSIIRIEDRSSKIDTIAAAVQSFSQMREETADKTIPPEELIAKISSIYAQLAKVSEEKAVLLKENEELKRELKKQKALNHSFQKSNRELER